MLCVSCVCKIDWHACHRLSPMTSPAELPWSDQGRQEQGGPQGTPGTVPSASVSSPGAELHCYAGYLVAHLCLTGNERHVFGASNLIKHTGVTTEKGMVPQDRAPLLHCCMGWICHHSNAVPALFLLSAPAHVPTHTENRILRGVLLKGKDEKDGLAPHRRPK